MKLLAPVLIALLFIGCGDDDSPTAPGDELVGTWVFVSGTGFESEAEGEAFAWVVRRDGTFSLFLGVDVGAFHCDRGSVGNCWGQADHNLGDVECFRKLHNQG